MYQDNSSYNKNKNKNINNKKEDNCVILKKFELPGSTMHYTPILPFSIDHMRLKINPDFIKKTLLNCEQELKIIAKQDIKEINLDLQEIKIHDVRLLSSYSSSSSSSSLTSSSLEIADFYILEDKNQLVIKLSESLAKSNSILLRIIYSAGYYKINGKEGFNSPRNGFHFIVNNINNSIDINHKNDTPAYQVWTQGEAMESRYWFPSVDKPQVKFPFEIEISVPQDFTVISNGVLKSKVKKDDGGNDNSFIVWKYSEEIPIAPYLISVVIGKFSTLESSLGKLPLYYHWPKEIKKEDAMLTFSETPQILEFFEEYFGTKFPYKKYSQVAVDNFEFGGMENSSCTTLTRRVLHDKKTSIDYKNDIFLVIHEAAHQWFGDLVTCRDWHHIWLNEGFATYCESLYWEKSRGQDEFHYNLIEYTDMYFDESEEQYERPIVTNLFKHPDELFDVHSYEKSGFILHMIRNHIGENKFRAAAKRYLEVFKDRSATSEDLLEILEEVTGKEMRSFFDQWVYRKGHPELDIEISMKEDIKEDITAEDEAYSKVTTKKTKNRLKKLKIKISQTTTKDKDKINSEDVTPYRFELDVRVGLSYKSNIYKKYQEMHCILISKQTTENTFDIPADADVEVVSIDPFFKILKEIKSIKVTDETDKFQLKKLLINQLNKGNTVIERTSAARLLKKLNPTKDIIKALQESILHDSFYGVSKEASDTLGCYYDKNNYEKSNTAYQTLVSILKNSEIFDKLRPEVKRSIVTNIGAFEREESVQLLIDKFLNPAAQSEESNFVISAAASAIGKSCKKDSFPKDKKKNAVSLLKDLIESSNTFQNVVATGAIDGLKRLSKDKYKDIVIDISKFLISNTKTSKDYFIRASATSALGKFLSINKNDEGSNEEDEEEKQEDNNKQTNNQIQTQELENARKAVFYRLVELLQDERRKIKVNACLALADKDARFVDMPERSTIEAMEALINVAKHDLDGFVRREAETCVNTIKDWLREWSIKPLDLTVK